jgi:hypothetical protein
MKLFFANATDEEKAKMAFEKTATNKFVDQAMK